MAWICKKCGEEGTVFPIGVKALEIDKEQNITSHNYEYAECENCGSKEEDIVFLAKWED